MQSLNKRLISVVALATVALCGCEQKTTSAPPAINYIVEAHQAIAEGDEAAALDALTKSIESEPNVWAYVERAQLYLEQGDEQKAIADCKAALEIDSDYADAEWLLGEIEKPAAKRFKGANASPPSKSK